MPGVKKKTAGQRPTEETKEVDDADTEDYQQEPKGRSKQVSEAEDAGSSKKVRRKKNKKLVRESDGEEGSSSAASGIADVRSSSRNKKGNRKKKEKNSDEGSSSVDEDSSHIDGAKDKRRAGKLPDVIPTAKRATKKKPSVRDDDMGSKDKKSKKDSEKEEEVEEESKKKKKDKKTKKDKDSDGEDTKKGKGKKKKVENYVEIYENEVRNYEPDSVENYEDEYHKKKGQ